MFEEFFDLRENPFALAPNPRFIFHSHEHIEALAHFRYWIENGEGFVLITGEVGTGKTTALFDLMAQLPTEWAVGFVANSTLVPAELLEEVCRRFRIDIPPGATKPTLLARLESFLNERGDHGLRSLLILDEAQNFEPRLLEEVRLLSNLERATGKLLQIALIGQPELDRKLELPELRQLRQRIGIRYRLGPLGEEECIQYIHHRVSVAGGDAERIFPPATANAIYKLTHGIPREINIVASQALITAFVQGAEQVQPEHVQSVVDEFAWSSIFGREVPAPQARRTRMSDSPPPRIGEPHPRVTEPPRRMEPQPRMSEPQPRVHETPATPRVVPPRIDPIRTRPPLEVLRGGGAERNRPEPAPGPYSEGVPPRSEPIREPPAGPPAGPAPRTFPSTQPAHPAAAHPGAGHSHAAPPSGASAAGSQTSAFPGTPPGAAYGAGGHPGALHPGTAAPPAGGAPSVPPATIPTHLPPQTTSHPPRRPTLLPEPEPRGRSPWILVAALIVLLAAIVGSAFWLRGERARQLEEQSPTGALEHGSGGAGSGEEKPNSPPKTTGEAAGDDAATATTSGTQSGEPVAQTVESGAAPEPPAERAPARTAAPATPVTSTTSRASNPAPARTPSAEPGTPSGVIDQDGDYVIHAASFVGDAAKIAEVRRDYEAKLGVPVAIVRVGMTGDPWWNRVYLGPYTTRAAAREAQAALERRGLLDPEAAVIRLSANRPAP